MRFFPKKWKNENFFDFQTLFDTEKTEIKRFVLKEKTGKIERKFEEVLKRYMYQKRCFLKKRKKTVKSKAA